MEQGTQDAQDDGTGTGFNGRDNNVRSGIARALRVLHNGEAMTSKVEKIVGEVKALPPNERDEFLSWLAEFEIEQVDDWDREIASDSKPGGRLEGVLDRVRKDIAQGRTKPLESHDIIAEVWRNRDAYTREHHHDLNEIVADLREREKQHPQRVVDRRARRTTESNATSN